MRPDNVTSQEKESMNLAGSAQTGTTVHSRRTFNTEKSTAKTK